MSGIIGKNSDRSSGVIGTATATIDDNQVDETKLKDALIGDFTDATVTASDYFLHGDATDSGNTKKDTIQGVLDLVSAGGFTLETEIATTSGTAHDWDIPSGTTIVIMTFLSSGTNGSDDFLVQIGDSGGIDASGYGSESNRIAGATPASSSSGAGFNVNRSAAGDEGTGWMIITKSSGNKWCNSHIMRGGAGVVVVGSGNHSLSAELNEVRLTRSGSDTFDSGTANVMYL